MKSQISNQVPLSEVVAEAADGVGSLPRPLQVTLNVTGRCNSRCQYCAYGDPDTMKRTDISYEHLAKQIEQLAALGVRALTISGGEPMLRKDLSDIIRFAADCGLNVTLITNASLLDIAAAQRLDAAGLSTLVLSFDSLEDELYRQIRGIAVNKPKYAFEQLQAFRRKTSCIPMVVVNIVLTRPIADRLLAHLDRLVPLMLPQDRIMVQAYQPPPELSATKDPLRFTASDRERLESLVEALIATQSRGVPLGNDAQFLRRLPGFLAEGELPKGFRCTIGYSSLYVKENFDVHPCWQLPLLGNLNDISIDRLWNSPAYATARERMKALDCRKCALVCHSPEFLDMQSQRLDHDPLP